MPATVVGTLLWVPFLFTVIIAGLMFGRTGYDRGVWRALIGLVAVVLAAGLSMVLSGLIASWLGPVAVTLNGLKDADAVTKMLSGSVLQSILSVLLFGASMFFLTALLRWISFRVRPALFSPCWDWECNVGAGVGVVTAVLFAVLWLSPLYSTLATYVPLAEKLIVLSEGDNAQTALIERYAAAIERNPIVRISGSGPVGEMYEELSKVKVQDTTISLPKVANTVDALTEKIEQLQYATTDEQRKQLCVEIAVLLRDLALEQDWLYNMAQAAINEQRGNFSKLSPNEMVVLEALLRVIDVPRDVFDENIGNVMDLVIYAMEHDALEALEEGDVEALRDSGTMRELGKLLNSTPQAVELKRLMLASAMAPVFGEEYKRAWDFLDKYGVQELTDPALQEQEALALMMATDKTSAGLMDIVMAHPCLGQAALDELIALSRR